MELIARAATETDADNMLGLMCRAFHMDAGVARRIFYSDPFYDLSLKRILTDASGALVSCLTLVPSSLFLGNGVSLSVCGVAGVCTEPALRGRGYAAELIDQTMAQIAAEFGFAVAALTAERPEYYRKLGWDVCGESVEITLPSRSIRQEASPTNTRLLPPDALPNLTAAVRETYRRNRGDALPGAFGRDERRWRCIEQSAASRQFAACFERESLTGYAVYSVLTQQTSPERQAIVLHEVVADTPQQELALLGCLSKISGCDKLQGVFSQTQADRMLVKGDPGSLIKPSYPVLMRTVNLSQLVKQLVEASDTRSKNELAICDFEMEILPSRGTSGESIWLKIVDGLVRIDTGGGQERATGTVRLMGGHGAITQLLLGYKTATELLNANVIEISCDDAHMAASIRQVCEQIFPGRDIFLAPLDLF